MIRFLIGLFILILCGLCGYAITTFPSSVAFKIFGYTTEIPLITWLILSFVATVILIWFFKLLFMLWNSPSIFSRNIEVRRQHKAHRLLRNGLQDMIAGDYRQAEKKLAKGGEIAEQLGDSSVLYFENAAIAADRQQASARRDQYFLRARQNADAKSQKMATLTEAESAVANGHYPQAEKLLKVLHSEDLKNYKILSLLDEVYAAQEKWSEAWQNLEEMRSQMPTDAFNRRKLRYAGGMLKDTAEVGTFDELHGTWQKLPADVRAEKEILVQYCGLLLENGHAEDAEKLLAAQIGQTRELDYIQMYSQLRGINYGKALKNMDQWAASYPNDAIFMYCYAQIAYRAREYDKAALQIEEALKRNRSPQALALWGQILEAQNRPEAALAAYRQSFDPHAQDGTLVDGSLLPSPDQEPSEND